MAAFHKTSGNTVRLPGAGDTVLFDAPLIGFAAADDDLFEKYKQPEIIGEYYFAPVEWLPSARTVISFLMPFTEEVRSSNRVDRTDPSMEWLYGRIEGQASFLHPPCTHLRLGVRNAELYDYWCPDAPKRPFSIRKRSFS